MEGSRRKDKEGGDISNLGEKYQRLYAVGARLKKWGTTGV